MQMQILFFVIILFHISLSYTIHLSFLILELHQMCLILHSADTTVLSVNINHITLQMQKPFVFPAVLKLHLNAIKVH